MIIEEDYVSYEVAKLLKEKGFDEDCIMWYEDDDYLVHTNDDYGLQSNSDHISEYFEYSAPTLQMAMKWLREEKNIFIVIEPHSYDYLNEKTSSYVFAIWEGDNYMEVYSYKNSELRGISYLTYEEAVEAALKYVLEKLI